MTNAGWVYSTVTVNSGGKLVGNGNIREAIIASGGTLSPGLNTGNRIGTLAFQDLTLNSGGVMEFNVKYDSELGLMHDEIDVFNASTLTINATPANRFTLKVISLNSDDTAGGAIEGGLVVGNTYQWLLFDTNGIHDVTSGNSTITAAAS